MFRTLITVLLLFVTIEVFAQTPDSCLKFYVGYKILAQSNPDSVLVDSCSYSPTYNKFFAKKNFYLKFSYNFLPRNYIASEDAVIEFTVNDIPEKFSGPISDFNLLIQKFGSFRFREINPHKPDTVAQGPRTLNLIFDNVVLIEEAEAFLDILPCLSESYYDWKYFLLGVDDEEDRNQNTLYPNPSEDIINIETGSESAMYEIINLQGMVIQKGSTQGSIDISALTPGAYLLNIGKKSVMFVKR